jgi:hypothetical protein
LMLCASIRAQWPEKPVRVQAPICSLVFSRRDTKILDLLSAWRVQGRAGME